MYKFKGFLKSDYYRHNSNTYSIKRKNLSSFPYYLYSKDWSCFLSYSQVFWSDQRHKLIPYLDESPDLLKEHELYIKELI